MRFLFALFLSLTIALAFGLGSTAHAMEPAVGSEVPQSLASLHSDKDSDQVPADAEKGFPHHHVSCHGDHIGVPVASQLSLQSSAAQIVIVPFDGTQDARVRAEPALRPPQA